MADDTYSRGYRSDPYGRGGPGDSGQGTDPLTELARLIGQSDPFSPDRGRQPDPRQPPPQSDWQADAAQHAQHYDPQHYDNQHYDSQHYDSRQYDHGTHDDRYAAGEPQQYADHGYGSAEQYGSQQSHQNGYAYPHAGQHEAGYGDAQGYSEQAYHQGQRAYQQEQQPAYYQEQPAYYHEQAGHHDPQAQAYPPVQPRYAQDHEAPNFGAVSETPHQGAHDAAADAPHAPVPGYPTPSFLGSDPNERPDEYYEDARAPRRGWLVTGAALVGLAVIGTAGAFAYRAVFTGGEARIITRDVQPSKITPAQTAQDANKPTERVASANQNERLGPPPEQPMPIPEPPRTVPPAPSQSAVAAPAPAPAFAPAPAPVLPPAPSGPSQAAAPADNGGGAPRRVRTEKIAPQQTGDVSGPRPATPPRIAEQAPPAGPNAPLSLAPQGIPDTPVATAPAPPRAAPIHTTAVAPPPAVERNTERRSAGGSGYYVQVSAQKSEEEAKSSFRGIAAHHASLLGGQQVVVRRKDLGSKGIFYGAQVGPFSREAASKLCEDLKAAGQGCMVQRN